MRRKILIAVVFLSVLSQPVLGDCWWAPSSSGVMILPEDPTSSDSVMITLSGSWPNSCVPQASQALVESNNIYFDIIHVDISDPIRTLGWLFVDGQPPLCEKAADSNDDGIVDMADAITVLQALFLGRAPLPPPFAECGADPTPDPLPCIWYPICE